MGLEKERRVEQDYDSLAFTMETERCGWSRRRDCDKKRGWLIVTKTSIRWKWLDGNRVYQVARDRSRL